MRLGLCEYLVAATLAVALCGLGGCDDPEQGNGDDGTGDTGADGDIDTDADADTDSDADSDSDADTDGYTGGDCTDTDYPVGPYGWYLDQVVSDESFSAIHDGEEVDLVMSDLHCSEIEALVFALGAND